MITRHPVSIRMYGIGIPAWIGLAAAGPAGCVVVALVATLIVLVGWE